jgi:translation initiation factor 2 beta subunit (eIF-2beta)/eIF-5
MELNLDDLDLKNLKKKKKIKVKKHNYDDEYNYTFLLERLYTLLKQSGKYKEKKNKLIIPAPILVRQGGKHIIWTNFAITARKMNRTPEHLSKYILSEICAVGSLTGDKSLNIKGRYRERQIHTLVSKYINLYVKCKNCKSINTELEKDKISRLMLMKCDCGANIYCQMIKK